MSDFYTEKPDETAEQRRFRIFAMTHKEPSKAADAWIADKARIAQLEAAARHEPVVVGYVNSWGMSALRKPVGDECYPVVRYQRCDIFKHPIYLDPQPPSKGE